MRFPHVTTMLLVLHFFVFSICHLVRRYASVTCNTLVPANHSRHRTVVSAKLLTGRSDTHTNDTNTKGTAQSLRVLELTNWGSWCLLELTNWDSCCLLPIDKPKRIWSSIHHLSSEVSTKIIHIY
jgi:hypothetical protein